MVKSIIKSLNEVDKYQHVMVSCAIMLDSCFFLPIVPSMVLTFTVGVCKEIWDKNYGTGFCWYDILANSLGIVLAILLNQMIN